MKNKKSCKHKNQERIDYGTNKCLDCNRFISTLIGILCKIFDDNAIQKRIEYKYGKYREYRKRGYKRI